MTVSKNARTWWKESSVYQIYPASFKDSTGNGTGDLRGIISKIDYLHKLGVDTVWLSPIFTSPQVDMGYDVANYREIDPQYGHIDDVLELKDRLHEKGMKLVMDLVVNHTSDQHKWFKQAKSSSDNKYRDYYIWRKPIYTPDGTRQPPNNWQSHFQGPAWTYDKPSDSYYLNLFCPEQPDLNWENPAVRAEVHNIMHFWLSRGIDGFRMDVINFISKPDGLPSSTSPAVPTGCDLYSAGPRLHEYLKGLGDILKQYDAFSVGEMPCVTDTNEIIKSVAGDRGELSMIFHFEFVGDMDYGPQGKFSPGLWTLPQFAKLINKWQRFMYDNNGWNALYLENHDQPRAINRFLPFTPELQTKASKLIALLQLLQAGTPFIYQGQELAMSNMPAEWGMEKYKDVDCLNHWNLHKNDTPKEIAAVRAQYLAKSRDNARMPMQWDATTHGGFTTGSPWMSVNTNYPTINAAQQVSDPKSPYSFWSRVLKIRKELKDIIVYGDFKMVDKGEDGVMAYERIGEAGKVLVVLNFKAELVEWKVLERKIVKDVVISSYERDVSHFSNGMIKLEPFEAAAISIE